MYLCLKKTHREKYIIGKAVPYCPYVRKDMQRSICSPENKKVYFRNDVKTDRNKVMRVQHDSSYITLDI